MTMLMTRTQTTTPNRTTSANRRSSENPTKTNKRTSDPQRNQSSSRIEIRAGELLHDHPTRRCGGGGAALGARARPPTR